MATVPHITDPPVELAGWVAAPHHIIPAGCGGENATVAPVQRGSSRPIKVCTSSNCLEEKYRGLMRWPRRRSEQDGSIIRSTNIIVLPDAYTYIPGGTHVLHHIIPSRKRRATYTNVPRIIRVRRFLVAVPMFMLCVQEVGHHRSFDAK